MVYIKTFMMIYLYLFLPCIKKRTKMDVLNATEEERVSEMYGKLYGYYCL